MASQIHFLDIKGKPLLSRDYKGDISSTTIEKFPLLLLELENTVDDGEYKPFINHEGINYIFINHNNLYICALTRKNENIMTIIIFLSKLVEVMTQYFKSLEEESIKDNFVIIYELLDEMMDFGVPQTTDTKILKEYITQDYYSLIKSTPTHLVAPPNALTNSVSWRKEGIFYKKNEAFLDVIESINMLITANGQVLNSEILGEIKIKSHLSGMPDLRLGLNDKGIFTGNNDATTDSGKNIEMEDIKFHQCVRLSKFENEKLITFIPPDGEFTLMSYRLSSSQFLMKPLILVNCKTKVHKHSRIEIVCTVKAQIKKKSTANNVEVVIPIPEDADTPKFSPEYGSVKWIPEKSCLIWKLKTFPGGKQFSMRAELGLPAVTDPESIMSKKPIKVNFSIPYFTTSGIQVRYLRINEPKLQYQSYPWVRYITQSGDDYIVRTK
ncbi:AP-1 complex subunit mu [Candida albicans P57072]|mgnify:CR=1 FL=1|uniref:Apm1p n=4 Tax=Candida albicans TaxID=5476 RepID=Q5AJY4_CANAL|nr:Apm1p [Candida albicans SC5314]EEQ46551.1 AP-1 complex subunit mu-1 [Candida albicans WO-1]KAF6060032.1 AP-1 complex subunit mu-1 [Candida albicans]KGQ86695.1 AP-1 complex subunit mu [Candida albicans P37005]KGR05969.1 AP-1 complex subunit mu [Candida albicans P57072]KGR07939.1 AP-1 complex subunit mu [Candida albicans P78048]KGR11394.1 AP-1 complex subunit mu [Candida albicans P37037]KGT67110.1 AP-1 complex subunit mu [Candida albicans 12C]KGU06479.1 AP-1 complex subunit mu [Candida alb|eukprot:XP_721944.1 Apm1p [Candida albicans SC5314]